MGGGGGGEKGPVRLREKVEEEGGALAVLAEERKRESGRGRRDLSLF